jgi:hypothetical protein
VSVNGRPRNSLPLSKEHALEPPAGGLEITRDAASELAGLPGGGLVVGADDQLGLREGGVDVDRGELPDRAVGIPEPSDVKAVDADRFAGVVDVDVALGRGFARRLIGRGVASDQPEPLGARVQP